MQKVRLPGKITLLVVMAILIVTAAGIRLVSAIGSAGESSVTTAADASAEPSAATDAGSPTPTPSPTATPSPTPLPTEVPTPTPWPKDGIKYYNGYADPRTITPVPCADPLSLTALVNKYYSLTEDFEPPLVRADGSWLEIQPVANEAWILLRDACKAETGIKLQLKSAYRSYAVQRYIFRKELAEKGVARTVKKNSLEGRSEHQLGLSIDVGDGDREYTSRFAETEAGLWLAVHAYEFGFILRYPEGKEAITDYAFEPWHFRFVGLEVAAICLENNYTLEEYVQTMGQPSPD